MRSPEHVQRAWSSGGFYALLALGLAVIFGMLRVVNFAHGAFYMLGAFGGVRAAQRGSASPFWAALVIIPLVVVACSAWCSNGR